MTSASARTASGRVAESSALMLDFAARSGLRASAAAERRYLWTDAFAVCNFLALERATGESRYRELALRLIERVHRVLGRHRADDSRTGWISELGERDGELHPTRGGLRIGKRLPERAAGARFDERLEWERDGQYFHYLTKWMHALDQTSRVTGDARFNTWARELAEVAHRAFVAQDRRGMAWKMSIDLSRPLVPSMGRHDPLDGFITALQLRATASALPGAPRAPDLAEAISDFAAMMRGQRWATADALGIGGLLVDAARVAQLAQQARFADTELLEALLTAALEGLASFAHGGELLQPAPRRLAFRELGLAIGLAAIDPIRAGAGAGLRAHVDALARYAPLGHSIESFWRNDDHRHNASWAEHRDINEVMLATCLAPDGLLALRPVSR